MPRLVCTLAILFALVDTTRGASAGMSGWFFAFGGNVYCATEIFPHEGRDRFLQCWRPRTGFFVVMTHRGSPKTGPSRHLRGHRPPTSGLLRVGETRAINLSRGRGFIFKCTVRPTTVNCVNRAGHGWWLGARRGYALR